MDDIVLHDYGYILSASKRRSYREHVLQSAETLVHFLQDNGLTTRTITPLGEPIPHGLKIRASDLTEEGIEFYKGPVQRWYHAQDRGTAPTDTRILERGLARIRAERKS